jgi:hypothetical protein
MDNFWQKFEELMELTTLTVFLDQIQVDATFLNWPHIQVVHSNEISAIYV